MINLPDKLQAPTVSDINRAVEYLCNFPQMEFQVKHYFSPGIYQREIFMPAGSRVIGKVHATRHLNTIVKGRVTLWTVYGRKELEGPCTFESMAGEQKVLLMHTDTIWMTTHPNPNDETSQEILENMFIRPQEQEQLFPELDSKLLLGEV